MRDEARNSFTLRDNAGYSKATLEAIDKGDATVIGGKILSVGDIVETKDGMGVVWSAGGGYRRKKTFLSASKQRMVTIKEEPYLTRLFCVMHRLTRLIMMQWLKNWRNCVIKP